MAPACAHPSAASTTNATPAVAPDEVARARPHVLERARRVRRSGTERRAQEARKDRRRERERPREALAFASLREHERLHDEREADDEAVLSHGDRARDREQE